MLTYRKIFGSLYVKISVSYIIIIVILVSVISVLANNVFIGRFEEELRLKNTLVLEQFRDNVDHFILEATDNLALYSLSSEPEVNKLFRTPIDNNAVYVQQAYSKMTRAIVSNPIYHSVYVYYKNNGLVVSNFGTYFLNEKLNRHNDFSWLIDQPPKPVAQWSVTKNFKSYATVDAQFNRNVITYLRDYPFGTSGDNRLGSIAINIDAEKLFARMGSLPRPVFADILIVDSKGNVIFDNDQSQMFSNVAERPLFRELLTNGFKVKEFEEDGKRKIAFTAKSAINDWIYINIVPLEVFSKERQSTTLLIFAIALVAIVFSIAISLFWAKRLYRPFGNLVRRSREISRELLAADSESAMEDKAVDLTLSTLVSKITELQQKIRIEEPELKNKFLRKLFENKYLNEEEIRQEMNELGLHFPYEWFTCLYLVPAAALDTKEVVLDALRTNLVYYIEHIEIVGCVKLSTDSYDGCVVTLVNSADENKAVQLAKDLLEYVQFKSETPFVAGIGSNGHSLIRLKESLDGAKDSLKYSTIKSGVSVFTTAQAEVWDQSKLRLSRGRLDQLERKLNEGAIEAIREEIKQLIADFMSRDYAFHVIQSELFLLVTLVVNKRNSLLPESPASLDLSSPLLLQSVSLIRIEELLLALCEDIAVALSARNDSKWNLELDQCKAFIREKIKAGKAEEITLVDVAQHVKKSPNYLSKMFSEGMGVSFKDYVVNLKLELAAEALHNPNAKINEVAKDFGYENTSYFIRIFKRKYGCTPKEYFLQKHLIKEDEL